MSIQVVGHSHDKPLILRGLGDYDTILLIQTGTLRLAFPEGPSRELVEHDVLKLPASQIPHFDRKVVRAIASASPSSVAYAGSIGSPLTGFVQGDAPVFGFADTTSGVVSGSARVALQVQGMPFAASSEGGSLAVEKTEASTRDETVRLHLHLSASGSLSFGHVAYSLFVIISQPVYLVIPTEPHPFVPPP